VGLVASGDGDGSIGALVAASIPYVSRLLASN